MVEKTELSSGKKTASVKKKRAPVKRVRAKKAPAASDQTSNVEQALKQLQDGVTMLNTRVSELERRQQSEHASSEPFPLYADRSTRPTGQQPQPVEPGAEVATRIWRTYRWQALWVLVFIDFIAWMASWESVFTFFFGIIMLSVFIMSLNSALHGYRRHYYIALHRLQEK